MKTLHVKRTLIYTVYTITSTLQSLTEEPIQQRSTVITECEPLVIVHHEAMWYVHTEPLSLLDTLVQLLRINIATYVTHLKHKR
jgi:hypothetical protein